MAETATRAASERRRARGERLTVLSVAYPLALVRAGHRSIVLACEGSRVAGELVTTPLPAGPLDDAARTQAHARYRTALAAILARTAVDIVHVHGLDFASYLPPPGPPLLATLHLPPAWYPAEVFALQRPRTHLVCVSADQRRRCPPTAGLIELAGVVENGVDLEALRPGAPGTRQPYVVALGRICPEKGFHRALAACRRAGVPMLLAGAVFPYPAHESYVRERIVPLLDHERRFLGPVGLIEKQRLLATARCVLVPSDVPETSSLVAMEALACGTPVITSGAGALAEIVEHGRTGYIVADEAGMAAALHRVHELDASACRDVAEQRFAADVMAARYVDLYRSLS